MIRLRLIFERGRAHPLLGPILLVVLVLLLAMVFLHVALDGMEAATEVGAICVAIASALGLLAVSRLLSRPPPMLSRERGGRSPPGRRRPIILARPTAFAAPLSSIPLRR